MPNAECRRSSERHCEAACGRGNPHPLRFAEASLRNQCAHWLWQSVPQSLLPREKVPQCAHWGGCGVVTFLLAPKEPVRNRDTPHPSKIGCEEPIFATLESRYDCPRQSWLLQDSLRGAPPRWGKPYISDRMISRSRWLVSASLRVTRSMASAYQLFQVSARRSSVII